MPGSREEDFKRNNVFPLYDHALAQEPLPPGSWKLQFLGHHYYTLSLSDLCLGVEKKIFKEIMHFYYMTYMAIPQHKNHCPGGHEIYNFGRPFLGHHYYIFSLSDLCLGLEKKIFLRNTSILHILLQKHLPLGVGVMKFTIPFSLPYRCYIRVPNLVKIGPVVLEKKMLTHDGRRQTPTHSNRSPELLRWPKTKPSCTCTSKEFISIN